MATDMIARAMAARALQIAESGSGSDTQFGLQSIEINKDGDLIVTFTDGTVSNLGRVVGADGKVYVPHLDKDTSILSWTIEDRAGAVPPPLDLSDHGEWEHVDEESMGETEYEWEILKP